MVRNENQTAGRGGWLQQAPVRKLGLCNLGRTFKRRAPGMIPAGALALRTGKVLELSIVNPWQAAQKFWGRHRKSWSGENVEAGIVNLAIFVGQPEAQESRW